MTVSVAFNHIDLPFPAPILDTVQRGEHRYYITPSGKEMPSVTTVLGDEPSVELQEWIFKVGEVEAERIKRVAGVRGTKFHELLENYIANKDMVPTLRALMPNMKSLYYAVKPYINLIDHVQAQELAMYSKALGVAGRIDLIANYDGIPSIIDFKTSKSPKSIEHIQNYFMQTSAYAYMYNERLIDFSLEIKPIVQTVIIIAVDNLKEPQIFIERYDKYIGELKHRIDKFYIKYNLKR